MTQQVSVSWHLIPDGTTTIVQVTIKGEFAVDTAKAGVQAEEVITAMISRISTHTEDEVRAAIQQAKWVGEWDRPDEPGPAVPRD